MRDFTIAFCNHEGESEKLRSEEGVLERLPPSLGRSRRTKVRLEVAYPPNSNKRSFFRSTEQKRLAVEEAQELQQTAACCPIPVLLDGRDVANLNLPKTSFGRPHQSVVLGIEALNPIKSQGLKVPKYIQRMTGQCHRVQSLAQSLGTLNSLKTEIFEVIYRICFHQQPGIVNGKKVLAPFAQFPSVCH